MCTSRRHLRSQPYPSRAVHALSASEPSNSAADAAQDIDVLDERVESQVVPMQRPRDPPARPRASPAASTRPSQPRSSKPSTPPITMFGLSRRASCAERRDRAIGGDEQREDVESFRHGRAYEPGVRHPRPPERQRDLPAHPRQPVDQHLTVISERGAMSEQPRLRARAEDLPRPSTTYRTRSTTGCRRGPSQVRSRRSPAIELDRVAPQRRDIP